MEQRGSFQYDKILIRIIEINEKLMLLRDTEDADGDAGGDDSMNGKISSEG